MLVRESQIEDVLATYPEITQKLLGTDKELSLLARQKTLDSGRLDLLFASEDKLLLLELKVENFKREFVDQVEQYRSDLLSLQASGLLLDGLIEAFLMCPVFTSDGLDPCRSCNIIAVEYSPSSLSEKSLRNRDSVK
jgi:hypothetical protein